MRARLRLAAVLGLACLAGPAAAGCRTALAIGLDVSGSVDKTEMALQTEGMARALTAPEVVRAFLPPGGTVKLAIYNWSGVNTARLILPWTEITGLADLDTAAAAVRASLPSGGRTALGQAMQVGAGLLGERRECRSLILDLTGDGFSNDGPLPDRVAAQMFRGLTINALAIADRKGTGEDPSLARLVAYFEAVVIRGPGAFVEPAEGFASFEAAMVRKLLRELGAANLTWLGTPPLRLASRGG
ncbi:MAG: DUF1194 domain-containing protein [Paracoccaceae bacterium]